MKKRLRKKRRIGEFAEKGCRLVVLRTTKNDSLAFNDAFILEAVEMNGCYCGGSLAEDRLDVVLELGRSSEDPLSRLTRIADWLRARSDVAGWRAGPILDLWHDPAEAFDLDPFATK